MRDAIEHLESTPALIVDLPVLRRNIERLAEYAQRHGINVRPHTKTHKSRLVARMQVEAGAAGLTAAKVGEAEVMAQVQPDVLIAYPTADRARAARVARLAALATLRVALDSSEAVNLVAEQARQAGSTAGVLVDIDVGFHRTGVQSPAAALELAQHVSRQSGVRLDGIFFYPGHVWSAGQEQAKELATVDATLREVVELWRHSGLEAKIVSGGSTPTAYQSHLVTSQTEIRPGTYVYNDMNTVRAGFCTVDDCAARIVCTVVSNAVPGKVVIDAGTKTLTSDRNATKPDSGFGHVVEYPQAAITRLSEEHGEIDVSHFPTRPHVGERMTVIPNHICPCINLRDHMWLRHGSGEIEQSPIDTRGMLS